MTRRPFKITGTFDIEAEGWDRFAIGATYDGHLPKVYYDGDQMIDAMRARGGVWFAHAAGVYDGLYVLERFRERGIACQIDRSQHRVTRIVAGSLTIRDSYGLWPVPLDDICGALGRPVPKLPWGCVCEKKTATRPEGCGGYCQIGPRAREGDPDLEAYVKVDCRDLYDGIVLLGEWTAERGIALRGTLGQTAWVAAQDELGVPESDITWPLYRHCKRADKGGRIAIIRPRAKGPGTHHDICNAYPAQLAKTPLPVGACRELGGRRAGLALDNAAPGIYAVTVKVPDDVFLPPLPWTHGGQSWYPTGEFSGTWTLPELVAAFERGIKIIKVHTALAWEATAAIFAPLVERWYAIRRAAGKKTPLGQWTSRGAKALTGKLAERPERNRVVMHPESIKVCLRQKSCRDGCTGRCGAYEQIDLFGHIYAIPYQRLGGSCYPQWSAYLRAATRVQWLAQAERFGTDLCFGNTDSIWSIGRQKPEPLGDGLGEWEYQGAWWDLEVRSPNTYAFRSAAPTSKIEYEIKNGKKIGQRVMVPGPLEIRGVPGLTEEDWARGSGVIERGISTFGASVGTSRNVDGKDVAGGLFRKRHRRWTLPDHERTYYGDRKLGEGGITWPLDAQEIRALVAARRAKR